MSWRGERFVLEGSSWARGQEVAIDPARCALTIGESVFRGGAVTPDSLPEGQSAAHVVVFRREFGRIRDRVVLMRKEPDELLLIGDLLIDCRRIPRMITLRREVTQPGGRAAEGR